LEGKSGEECIGKKKQPSKKQLGTGKTHLQGKDECLTRAAQHGFLKKAKRKRKELRRGSTHSKRLDLGIMGPNKQNPISKDTKWEFHKATDGRNFGHPTWKKGEGTKRLLVKSLCSIKDGSLHAINSSEKNSTDGGKNKKKSKLLINGDISQVKRGEKT